MKPGVQTWSPVTCEGVPVSFSTFETILSMTLTSPFPSISRFFANSGKNSVLCWNSVEVFGYSTFFSPLSPFFPFLLLWPARHVRVAGWSLQLCLLMMLQGLLSMQKCHQQVLILSVMLLPPLVQPDFSCAWSECWLHGGDKKNKQTSLFGRKLLIGVEKRSVFL